MDKCKNCDQEVYSQFRQQGYCRRCFPETCLHFFRAAFGKHRVIRDGEKVLVACSGGPASTAMVELVKMGLSDGATKKLRFVPVLFHLDEREASADAELGVVKRTVEESGFEHAIWTFSEALNDVSLLSVLSSRGEATARHSLRLLLRRRALLGAARGLGCGRVLVGDSGTRTAAAVMDAVVAGRGAEVADTAAFADSRFSPTIVRPMLEFRAAECQALLDLRLVSCEQTAAPAAGSLQRLTARSLRDLEPNFPATNFAVVRTAAKIRARDATLPRCRLCESVIDVDEDPEESAVKDLRFSFERIGQEMMKDTALCYGCQILAHKHPPLRLWLTSAVDN